MYPSQARRACCSPTVLRQQERPPSLPQSHHPPPPPPPAAQGVLLTHRAVSTEVASFCHWISHAFVGINTETTYLSFLPLAHIYGRQA